MILNGSWAEYSDYELWLGRSDHSFSLVQDSNHHCSSLLHGLNVTCTHPAVCSRQTNFEQNKERILKKTGRRVDRTWKAWFNPLWTSKDIYIYDYICRLLKRITSGVLKDFWKFHKVPLNFAASKRMMHFTRSAPWFSCLIAAFLRGAGNCPFPIPSNPYDWGIGLKFKVFNDTLQNPLMSIMRTSKNDTAGHNIPCVYHTNSIYIYASVCYNRILASYQISQIVHVMWGPKLTFTLTTLTWNWLVLRRDQRTISWKVINVNNSWINRIVLQEQNI